MVWIPLYAVCVRPQMYCLVSRSRDRQRSRTLLKKCSPVRGVLLENTSDSRLLCVRRGLLEKTNTNASLNRTCRRTISLTEVSLSKFLLCLNKWVLYWYEIKNSCKNVADAGAWKCFRNCWLSWGVEPMHWGHEGPWVQQRLIESVTDRFENTLLQPFF